MILQKESKENQAWAGEKLLFTFEIVFVPFFSRHFPIQRMFILKNENWTQNLAADMIGTRMKRKKYKWCFETCCYFEMTVLFTLRFINNRLIPLLFGIHLLFSKCKLISKSGIVASKNNVVFVKQPTGQCFFEFIIFFLLLSSLRYVDTCWCFRFGLCRQSTRRDRIPAVFLQ